MAYWILYGLFTWMRKRHKFQFQQIKLQEVINYLTTARVEAAEENQHFQLSACAAAIAFEDWKNHLTRDLLSTASCLALKLLEPFVEVKGQLRSLHSNVLP